MDGSRSDRRQLLLSVATGQRLVPDVRGSVRVEHPPDPHKFALEIARKVGFPRVRLGHRREEWIAAGNDAWLPFASNASVDAVAEVLLEFDRPVPKDGNVHAPVISTATSPRPSNAPACAGRLRKFKCRRSGDHSVCHHERADAAAASRIGSRLEDLSLALRRTLLLGQGRVVDAADG